MREFLKKMQTKHLFVSIIGILAGVLLIIFSTQVAQILCYFLACTIAVYGIIRIISYFAEKAERFSFGYDLAIGMGALIFSIIIFFHVDFFANSLPVLLGIVSLIAALLKFQQGVDLLRSKSSSGWAILLSSLILGALGCVVIAISNEHNIVILLFGIGLIINSIFDIIAFTQLSKISKESQIINDTDER